MALCLLKIFERVFKNRLEFFLETEGIVPRTQFGFRKSRSCLDNMAILSSNINNTLGVRECVAAVFVDLEGAYDNVILHILI